MHLYYLFFMAFFLLCDRAEAKSVTYRIEGDYAVITSLNFARNDINKAPAGAAKSTIGIRTYKNGQVTWYGVYQSECKNTWDDIESRFHSAVGVRLPISSDMGFGAGKFDYVAVQCRAGNSLFYMLLSGGSGEVIIEVPPPPPKCAIEGYDSVQFSLKPYDSAVKTTGSMVRCTANADFKMKIEPLYDSFPSGVSVFTVFENNDKVVTYRNVSSVNNRIKVTAESKDALSSISSGIYLVTLEIL